MLTNDQALNLVNEAVALLHKCQGPVIKGFLKESFDVADGFADEPSAQECKQLFESIFRGNFKALLEPKFARAVLERIARFVGSKIKLTWNHIPSWLHPIITALIEVSIARGNYDSSKLNFFIRVSVTAVALLMLEYSTGFDPVSHLCEVVGLGNVVIPMTTRERALCIKDVHKLLSYGADIFNVAQMNLSVLIREYYAADEIFNSLELRMHEFPAGLQATIKESAQSFCIAFSSIKEAAETGELKNLVVAMKNALTAAQTGNNTRSDVDNLKAETCNVLEKWILLNNYRLSCGLQSDIFNIKSAQKPNVPNESMETVSVNLGNVIAKITEYQKFQLTIDNVLKLGDIIQESVDLIQTLY